jgi:hypothetical protein
MLTPPLSHLATHDDVGRLFAALGYALGQGPALGDARVVARWRGFQVVARPAPDPAAGALELARALARAGERGLAAVWGANALAVAAPRPGLTACTRALVVPLPGATPAHLEQLASLSPSGRRSALELSLRVAEALSTEAAGNRFFLAFRLQFERMAAALDARLPETDRRFAALLSLTRVLFLYFIQAKGWLDGRRDYLRTALDDALHRNRDFHRLVLEPLFFGTLNVPAARRSNRARLGAIPYLNGGLFEPHLRERRPGRIRFSNELWRLAFDELFERFRFCVREANEVDTIAPDMLGRVFERLMAPDARHQSGAYYTPEPVVHALVAATIEAAMTGPTRLPPPLAGRAVRGETLAPDELPLVRRGLERLRILDPAVGTGAFLLGALDRLTVMYTAARYSETGDARALRRRILQRHLFGVDINPMAVRLAELRLWLAVVADDPAEDVAAVAPLPNLDGVVRQGDALLDPIAAVRAWLPAVPPASLSRPVETSRAALFEARGGERQAALRRLRQREAALARHLLRTALSRCDRELRELAALAGGRDLFGRRVGLSPEQRERARRARQDRAHLAASLTALEQDTIPFFSFDVHLPEIAAPGGFTAVVGNPPWVRAERLAPGVRARLAARFRWWRAGGERGYRHLPDLALAFLERAVELAGEDGVVGFLLPSKVVSAGYAGAARRHLVREATIEYVHRVSDDTARFGATTYPLALVVRKTPPPAAHAVRLDFAGSAAIAQASLDGGGPWILVPDACRAALRAFEAAGDHLGSLATPALGVKTGADPLLVGVVVETRGEVHLVRFGDRTAHIEASVLRPALRGRDVRAFLVQSARVVLWGLTPSGTPRLRLPRLAARYVSSIDTALRKRVDYRGGPSWTLFRTGPSCTPHRVVWPDIGRRPRAVALDETHAARAVPLNTCYVCPLPDRVMALVVAAVLNSTWAAALLTAITDEARGGYRRLTAQAVARTPIPTSPDARATLSQVSAEVHHHGFASQPDLDRAVAEALELPSRTTAALRKLARHYGL